MSHIVRAHTGYKLMPGGICLRVSEEIVCIRAYVEKEIIGETKGILDYLSCLSHEESQGTLEDWFRKTETQYGVRIEKEEDTSLAHVKVSNVKVLRPINLYIKITKAA